MPTSGEDKTVTPLFERRTQAETQPPSDKAIDALVWSHYRYADRQTTRGDLKRKFAQQGQIYPNPRSLRKLIAKIFGPFQTFKHSGFKGNWHVIPKPRQFAIKCCWMRLVKVTFCGGESAPDTREGPLWKSIRQHGHRTNCGKTTWLIRTRKPTPAELFKAFSEDDGPQTSWIVVDKLLTGFWWAEKYVLYNCKPLKQHSFDSAICAVNRFCTKDKDFWLFDRLTRWCWRN